VAFDGLSKLFDGSTETEQSSDLQRLDSQPLSNSNYKISSDGHNKIIKSNSEKHPEEAKLMRNRLSEDNRHAKALTLSEKQLQPMKGIIHTLKDENLPSMVKTPILSINDKIENLNSNEVQQKYGKLSESFKSPKPDVFLLKSEASRNYSIFSPNIDNNADKNNAESLADKFVKRSVDISRKRTVPTSSSIIRFVL